MKRNLEELFGLVKTTPSRPTAEDTWTHYRGNRSYPISRISPKRVNTPKPLPALVAGFIGVVLYGAMRGK